MENSPETLNKKHFSAPSKLLLLCPQHHRRVKTGGPQTLISTYKCTNIYRSDVLSSVERAATASGHLQKGKATCPERMSWVKFRMIVVVLFFNYCCFLNKGRHDLAASFSIH